MTPRRWSAECGQTQHCNYVNYELPLLPTVVIVSTCHWTAVGCRWILLDGDEQIEIAVTEKGSVSPAPGPSLPNTGSLTRQHCHRTRECKSSARRSGNSLPAQGKFISVLTRARRPPAFSGGAFFLLQQVVDTENSHLKTPLFRQAFENLFSP